MPSGVKEYELNAQARLRVWHLEPPMADDAFLEMLERERHAWLELQSQRLRLLIVLEFAPGFALSARQRKIQSEWLATTASIERDIILGKAYVTTSRVLRGAITAVYWLSPPEGPYTVVASMIEALTWGAELCARSGHAVPLDRLSACIRDTQAAI